MTTFARDCGVKKQQMVSQPNSKQMESRIKMNEDGVRVTKIDWLTAVPSLRLCDAVCCAVSPRALIPVALFLYLSCCSASLFRPWFESRFDIDAFGTLSGLSKSAFENPHLLGSFPTNLRFFGTRSLSESFESIISLAAMMLVFGFCAIPVLRLAGGRICGANGCGLLAGVKLSLRSWKAILTSSLLALMLLILLCLTFRTSRWIGGLTFESITSLTALLYIVGCLVLSSGWLLSLAAIAIDRCDGAEALSRGINYVLSRWPRVVIYTVAGFVLIEICNAVFGWLAGIASLLSTVAATKPNAEVFKPFAEVLRMSLFLCELAIAYVLLRNVEDGVSLHEIDGGQRVA